MRRFAMFLATVGLGVLLVAGIVALKRSGPDFSALTDSGAEATRPVDTEGAKIEAELARLHGLPGETLPSDLGTIAGAKVACAGKHLTGEMNPVAVEAATRLFVVLFAIRKETESPLIDPAAYDVKYDKDKTTGEVRLSARKGKLTDERLQDWVYALDAYSYADHPIYAGLDLAEDSWAFADLQKIIIAEQDNQEQVEACYRKRFGG